MKQTALIVTTLILIISCAILKEKETTKYSELAEWGFTSGVKYVKALYYKNIRENGGNLIPVDKEQWDRMTIVYYNKQGMIDSLKVHNSMNSSPLTYIYVTKDEIIKSYLVSDSDTILFSKKYWKSKYNYISEVIRNNRVVTKELSYLDEKLRAKELKREYYDLKDDSIKFSTAENLYYYFNENNQLDSIRTFINGKMEELILNVDIEFDRNKNPIKSSKKIGQTEPYLIIREYTYY